MGKQFDYGVYGVGRIGKVHASIILEQGHRIVAIGDDEQTAVFAAQEELDAASVKTFNNPEDMVRDTANELDAVIIASHTKDHARHALPFVKAQIPIYLEKPLTDDLEEAFDFVEAIGRDEGQIQIGLQRRYDLALLHAKELLDSGLIGDIREIRCILRDQFPPPETYIIGTEGTLHVGRFAGYPGPIHVELWKNDGTRHSSSRSFEMTYLKGDYPEFLPRFDIAYRNAHRLFRDVVETGESFAVTQNHVLDAQVFVEAAHRSAQNKGLHYKIDRFDDLQQYKLACISNGLVGSE